MYLFHVILKLISEFALTTTEEYNRLANDVKAWESECLPESEDKVKSLYYKLHKGVFVRLLMPFLYFFLVKWVSELKNGNNQDEFLD